MKPQFETLPEDCDLYSIASALREIILKLHEEGRSYESIAVAIHRRTGRKLAANAIRIFLRRDEIRNYRASNATLGLLYNYVSSEPEDFPKSVAKLISERLIILKGGNRSATNECIAANALAMRFRDWIEVPASKVAELISHLCGDEQRLRLLVFRRSLHEGHIVKSHLELHPNRESRTLFVEHYQRDRMNDQKVSRGVLMPVHDNIYSLLKIDNGKALENLALENVDSYNFTRLNGFLTGYSDRRIFTSSVVVRRDIGLWHRLPGRFPIGSKLDVLNQNEYEELTREVELLTPVTQSAAAFLEPMHTKDMAQGVPVGEATVDASNCSIANA
jgi:hypothetical protein